MNQTILIIDDIQDVRENIGELLELSGYHVLQASEGYEGIRKAKQHQPDLILCDIMMPGMDGYGVAEILARQEETNHIPLIYLTAKAEPSDFKKGLQKGATDYITKPFESDELIKSISLRIRQHQQQKPTDLGEVEWQNWMAYLHSESPLDNQGAPLTILNLTADETLFEQDDQALWVYFLQEGSIRWESTDAGGRTVCHHLSRPGEFLGWSPGFHLGAYSHSAIALSTSRVVRLSAKQLRDTLLSNPGMALIWGQAQLKASQMVVEDMMAMLYGNARENVARVLLRFAEFKGGQWTVNMPRETLAKSIGIAYETVIRTLSQFKAEGLVMAKGRRITIYDKAQLEAVYN
jgi:CheY-like chemotaxis protein/CRP-like cAMP-binding protein